MKTVRTPDDRFADLPDYPFEPALRRGRPTATAGTLRVHYLDEGPADAAPVLLLHGEPSWCYLYRHMIPVLVAAGHRVHRPRPRRLRSQRQADGAAPTTPTPATSSGCAQLLFDHLDLRDITFFGQDWGGLIGLRLVAEHPDRFARVVVGNTGLPTGDGPPSDAFLAWQKFSQESPRVPDRRHHQRRLHHRPAARGDRRLRRPVPRRHLQGRRPHLPDARADQSPTIPASADNGRRGRCSRSSTSRSSCAFSDERPDHQGRRRAVPARRSPAREGQPHTTIEGGGHFLQEDQGPELARGHRRRSSPGRNGERATSSCGAALRADRPRLRDAPGDDTRRRGRTGVDGQPDEVPPDRRLRRRAGHHDQRTRRGRPLHPARPARCDRRRDRVRRRRRPAAPRRSHVGSRRRRQVSDPAQLHRDAVASPTSRPCTSTRRPAWNARS